MSGRSWASTAFWSFFLCSVSWYFCRWIKENTGGQTQINMGHHPRCSKGRGWDPVALQEKMDCLPLFLYQRSLPPGDEASSASSSWSRRRSDFWGPSCQKCRFWCLWQWQTSGEPDAEELCSKQGGLIWKKRKCMLKTPGHKRQSLLSLNGFAAVD